MLVGSEQNLPLLSEEALILFCLFMFFIIILFLPCNFTLHLSDSALHTWIWDAPCFILLVIGCTGPLPAFCMGVFAFEYHQYSDVKTQGKLRRLIFRWLLFIFLVFIVTYDSIYRFSSWIVSWQKSMLMAGMILVWWHYLDYDVEGLPLLP